MDDNSAIVWVLAAASVVTFVVSLLAMPMIVVRIPEDYFAHERRPPSRWKELHPMLKLVLRIGRNALGVLFIFGGMAMLALPGQGLLTMFAGFVLIEFPGKYRLEKWLLRRRVVRGPINWLRRKRGRAPLEMEPARRVL